MPLDEKSTVPTSRTMNATPTTPPLSNVIGEEKIPHFGHASGSSENLKQCKVTSHSTCGTTRNRNRPFDALQIRLSRSRLISFSHFLFRPLLEPPPPLLASPTSPSP